MKMRGLATAKLFDLVIKLNKSHDMLPTDFSNLTCVRLYECSDRCGVGTLTRRASEFELSRKHKH